MLNVATVCTKGTIKRLEDLEESETWGAPVPETKSATIRA